VQQRSIRGILEFLSTSLESLRARTKFLPLYTTYCGFAYKWWVVFKIISTPPFLEDENIFQKSAPLVKILPQFRLQPMEPIFEKCSHLREKGGADFFPGLYG
jgi:hypothetical protein